MPPFTIKCFRDRAATLEFHNNFNQHVNATKSSHRPAKTLRACWSEMEFESVNVDLDKPHLGIIFYYYILMEFSVSVVQTWSASEIR